MGGKFGTEIVLVVTSIVGLAVIAVIVSKKSATGDIIGAAGTALSNTIGAAVKPITG